MRRARHALALLAVIAGIAGCGSPAGSQAAGTQAPAHTESAQAPAATDLAQAPAATGSTEAPEPAGKLPSPLSVMVCAPKAVADIAEVMTAKADLVPPTWTDHLYSCGFRYSAGTMVLSIKELSSWSQTYGYFDQLAKTMHETTPIKQLGQGAFITSNGSVVVRKDWKVLLVNITAVHGEVGSPPKPPGELAIYVAEAILGCWAGD